MTILWIFLALAIAAQPSASLICYQCSCSSSTVSACDCDDILDVGEDSHCIIVKDFHFLDSHIELSSTVLNSSYIRIKDPYYVRIDESIVYNEETSESKTKIKRLIYGCDWDYCNRYSLISRLSNSVKLTIDNVWLQENIYGTGSVTACHTCSGEISVNQKHSIDYTQCPFSPCTDSTTCSLHDLWHDVDKNELYHRSECTKSVFENEFSEKDEKYKVEVEGIVYLAQDRFNFEIWQLNINCAAHNCTRTSIAQELKVQIKGDITNLADLPAIRPSAMEAFSTIRPPLPLRCYNCSCVGTTCPCTTYEISSAENTYCSIVRENFGQDVYIRYGHIYVDSTYSYIREFPFVLVEEAIVYSETTGRWDTRIDYVIYGCDWDLCNKPQLTPYLVTSFLMRLPEAWLNSSILGSGQPVRDCHICPDGAVCIETGFIDGDLCPIEPCNTTCLIASIYRDPASTDQCYESYCAPPDDNDYEIDKHRVEIEGILYASRPTDVEVWEIYAYCRADNCSRPEIFQEIQDNLLLQAGDVTIIFNQTIERPKIRCFDCYCEGEQNCECDTVVPELAKSSYCMITRNYDGENVYVYFSHLEYGSSYSNVREFPYLIIGESIFYDNETDQWLTRTNEIIYGCNWDYCNHPSLLPLLPSSLQMSLPESWLNSNILGSGQPVHDCHECSNSSICSLNNTIDGDLCPIQPCNATCYVSNVYSTPINNEQCYQSYCVPENSEEFTYDTHLVDIQAVIYPSQPTNVELWEVYVYCQADNCSRPDIFEEIKQELIVDVGNVSSIFNQTDLGEPGQLRCYQCTCINDPVCACNTTSALRDNLTYCTIIRLYEGQDVWIYLEHIDQNSSRLYIREFPFLLVEESILYNEVTGRWNTRPTLIVYGCNTDYCNDPSLVPKLPISFQIRVPETWLNSSVLGTNEGVQQCHECPDTPQCVTTGFLNTTQCPILLCNSTCVVSDVFDDPSTGLQCYQSYCMAPDDEEYDMYNHRVEIQGILYGNRPNARLELWEVDIYCSANDCTRPTTFKELQEQIIIDTGDLSPFFNITTIPTTTTAPTMTTTAPPVAPILSCYECACFDNPTCSCNTVKPGDAHSTYCTIIRVNYNNGHFSIDLEHVDRNTTRVYIRKFPYLLAEESILYNASTTEWDTKTNVIIYGCNWNLCNHPSLIPLLPSGFQMTLSDEWLNKNVLDNGAPNRNCHECPDGPQCGTANFVNVTQCPIQQCNNTCIVSDLFDEPSSDVLCYNSYCSATETDFEDYRNRVELTGIVYGDQQDAVELWEVDVYCRADDCSRPEIFDEIRQNLTLGKSNLTDLLDNATRPIIEPEIICYDCFCYDDPLCTCEIYTVSKAKTSYCTIIRQNIGEDFFIALEHVDRNSSRIYIREFPYLLVEESILYDNVTGRWNEQNDIVVFGCNTDYCNNPGLLPHLPDSFQMRLPDSWLNMSILGNGQPAQACHACPDGPVCSTDNSTDISQCPLNACNTTCVVLDTYYDSIVDGRCYQSLCAPPDSEFFQLDPYRIQMEGILYGSRPTTVELREIVVNCRADNCSRPEIFKEIRNNFCVVLGDYTDFFGNTSTIQPGNSTAICAITTTTSTASTTSTTGRTTVSSETTTSPSGSTRTSTTVSGTPTRTIVSSTSSRIPSTSIGTTSRSTDSTGAPAGAASICALHSILFSIMLLIFIINLS